LFGLDAFAGGFVVQTFIAFWLIDRLDATTATVGGLLAAIGVIQTLSFLAAPLIARRWGLLNTMVFTHLPSNLLLAAVAFAPSFAVAAGLLLARSALSQMDVPTRQAYVMTLVDPEERTAAIAYTNTARYIVRPIGPLVAGAALTIAAGAPFIIAGALKSLYDLTLWRWFRTIPLSNRKEASE
jgi:predicted MFS family arabinose efflux permease